MKVPLMLLGAAMICTAAPPIVEDPFAPGEPLPFDPSNPDRDLPKMMRIQVEFIEVAHADFTKLLAGRRNDADATELRKKLAEMVETDRAEVVETMMTVCRSGEKATVESIHEFIYPAEYEPPELPGSVGSWTPTPEELRRIQIRSLLRIPYTPPSFETRNRGTTFQVAPNLGWNDKTIDLNFAPEIVFLTGFSVHSEFTAVSGEVHQDRLPLFAKQSVNTALTCMDGQYVLVTVLTPSGDDGQLDPGRKVIVMLKCDVLVVK
ncbi:hypothetical protein HAHE_28940 [Haloferula helveola]|uniref:Uncharacterized protein n=1 Tax=Haloferula helveola TaxID=490095 RepID=A0ABN6H5S7_9BACT|nr:hypothetical protein HAHE_28940 [Haloferula helveola]